MPTEKKPDLSKLELDSLFAEIREVGFPLVGAVDLDLAAEMFAAHSDRYAEWIESGFQGDMQYLVRGLDRRQNPRLVFPAAESVIVAAIPYRRSREDASAESGAPSLEETPRYARYLDGPDYHTHLPKLLTTALTKWSGASNSSWKICVDTSAVLEKSWAAITGLGWIGKNTLLINPKLGSYLFLAVVLLDRKTGVGPAPLQNYCGNCTRCLSSCPTEAFSGAGLLDSRKCISYLTLEKRGDWSPEIQAVADKMGTWVAGCDICQEVCPYNTKPVKMPETWPSDERDSALTTDWMQLEGESEEAYRARAKPSALSRIKFAEMKRNLQNAKRNADD